MGILNSGKACSEQNGWHHQLVDITSTRGKQVYSVSGNAPQDDRCIDGGAMAPDASSKGGPERDTRLEN